MTIPILFISGAGLPSWAWDDVRAGLPAERMTSVAALPRAADGGQSDAHLAEYAAKVLAEAPWNDFVVVAHSLGGVIGSEVVAQAPERVTGFLAVCAAIPAVGSSFLQSLPTPQHVLLAALTRIGGTRPPESQIRKGLASDLDESMADALVRDLENESLEVYRDEVSPRAFPEHRGYLHTTEDRTIAPDRQELYADELGIGWRGTLPTGHLPMLADATGTTRLLLEFLG